MYWQALQTTPWVEEAGRREKEAATQTEEREEEQEGEKREKYVRKERDERDMGVQVEETDPELFNFDREVRQKCFHFLPLTFTNTH